MQPSLERYLRNCFYNNDLSTCICNYLTVCVRNYCDLSPTCAQSKVFNRYLYGAFFRHTELITKYVTYFRSQKHGREVFEYAQPNEIEKWVDVYKNDRKHGKGYKIYRKTKKLAWWYQHHNGMVHGVSKHWFENGQLHCVTHYRLGKSYGLEQEWDMQGKLLRQKNWDVNKETNNPCIIYQKTTQ